MNLLTTREFTIKDLVIGPYTQRTPYRRRTGEEKINLHWGQRKLHLSEVEFFTLYWDPIKIPRPTCVYAGAAPGTHITLLSKMFPNFTFHLYDPGKFGIDATDHIHLHNEYFTEDIARQYAGRNDVLFLSDIRTADHKNAFKEELAKRGITQFDEEDEPIGPEDVIIEAHKVSEVRNEDQIWGDMKMQQSWVQIMNPEHAFLKFRLPYALDGKDIHVSYLRGLVYWQVWPPQTSSETRLKPVRNAQGIYDVSEWSIIEYEQWCFHHNAVTREQWHYKNIFTGTNEPIDAPELMNDYDSTAEAMILRLYLEKTGIRDPAQLYERVKQLSRLTTLILNHGNADSPGLGARRNSPIKTSGRAAYDAFRKKGKGKALAIQGPINAFQHTQLKYDTTWRSIIAPCTELTFAVNGFGGLDHTRLVKDLTSAGFRQVANNAQQVHVSWGELNYKLHEKGVDDNAFRNQQAALKASLGGNISDVTDKMNLYNTMRIHNPQGLRYLPVSRAIATVNNVMPNEILIGKPKGGFLSQGIEVITNDAELQAFRTKTKDEAIVSAYIANPLLVDGYKFHLRVYLLLYVNQGYYRAYVHDQVDVLTAAEPYQAGNWRRREIHLSGTEFTTRSYSWPDALASTTDPAVLQRANAAVPVVAEAVATVAGKRIAPYPEAGAAMEILGLDIMFDQLGNAFLLEVNSKVGFAPMASKRSTHNVFSDAMFNWLDNSVVLPHFGLTPAPKPLVGGKALTEVTEATAGTLAPFSTILNDLALLPVAQANDAQVQLLGTIGSIPEVFERVGEGRPWTTEFIARIRDEALTKKISPCRDTYDWIVLYEDTVVGYVGIRSFTHGKYNGPQLYYFFDPKYRSMINGFNEAAVTLACEVLRALAFPNKYRLYLLVGTGIPIVNTLNFNKIDSIMMNNLHFDVYYTDLMTNTIPRQIRKTATAPVQSVQIIETSKATVDIIPNIPQPIIARKITAVTPIAPISSSVITPISSPVVVPIATLISSSAVAHINSPVITPIRSPTVAPISSPVIAPIRSPTVAPISSPVVVPVATPISSSAVAPIRSPVIVPIRSPTIAPVIAPIRSPTVAPVVIPIRSSVIAPISSSVVAPISSSVVAPIRSSAVAPIVAPVRSSIVAPVVTPIATPVVASVHSSVITPIIVRPPVAITSVGSPIIAPVSIVRPQIIAPVAQVITPASSTVPAQVITPTSSAVLRPAPLVPRPVIATSASPLAQGRV